MNDNDRPWCPPIVDINLTPCRKTRPMKFRTSQVRNALTDVRHVLASLKSAVETAGDLTPDSVRQDIIETCREYERSLWDLRNQVEQASQQDTPPAEKAK